MDGNRISFQFYPSETLIDYFLISELAFIIHPKIKQPRAVRIVKRRAGFCWYYMSILHYFFWYKIPFYTR